MTGATASLLLPGLLTLILYAAAVFIVVASRRKALGRRTPPRPVVRLDPPPRLVATRPRPRLRVISGGLARASGQA